MTFFGLTAIRVKPTPWSFTFAQFSECAVPCYCSYDWFKGILSQEIFWVGVLTSLNFFFILINNKFINSEF